MTRREGPRGGEPQIERGHALCDAVEARLAQRQAERAAMGLPDRCADCGVAYTSAWGPHVRDGGDPTRCRQCVDDAELRALADAGDPVARALVDAPPDDEP